MKKIIKKTLSDPKHWLGWIISTFGIWILLKIFNAKSDNIFLIIFIFLMIIFIDVMKHRLKLQ